MTSNHISNNYSFDVPSLDTIVHLRYKGKCVAHGTLSQFVQWDHGSLQPQPALLNLLRLLTIAESVKTNENAGAIKDKPRNQFGQTYSTQQSQIPDVNKSQFLPLPEDVDRLFTIHGIPNTLMTIGEWLESTDNSTAQTTGRVIQHLADLEG